MNCKQGINTTFSLISHVVETKTSSLLFNILDTCKSIPIFKKRDVQNLGF